jgi:hypothetical protein
MVPCLLHISQVWLAAADLLLQKMHHTNANPH